MKIFYSLPGEGLGHAIRTLALIEKLKEVIDDLEVHIFTWGEAHIFYKKMNYPFLHEIVSIPFGRTSQGRISIIKTFFNFINFLRKYDGSLFYIINQYFKKKPDLLISDFEGILPRAANILKIPYIAIDNQHKFSHCKLDYLPIKLKIYGYFMGLYTKFLMPNPKIIIISTFYYKDVKVKKKHFEKVFLTNCFIRKSCEDKINQEDFLLVYYKSSSGNDLLKILSKIPFRVKVYGCPVSARIDGPFEYYDLSNESFVRDLKKCKCLFAAAGNQLLGECVYYNKKILAIPEPNQPEQEINGYYINKMGYGISCSLENLSPQIVSDFIDNCDSNLHSNVVNGTDEAVEIIFNYLRK